MELMTKTPFNPNRLETDPNVYGLRENIIKESITELYNDKSLLITGARGIGKSSLSYQLQKVLSGDNTLLTRCSINIKLPRYITVDYTCADTDTLEDVVFNVVQKLERELDDFKSKYEVRKTEVGFSFLSLFNAKVEIDKKDDRGNNTLIQGFIDIIVKAYDIYVDPHINVVLDELDQLHEKHNIAHFIKVVLETLNRQGINGLSFIFAGQSIILSILLAHQPSFNRIVKHIELKPLNTDDSLFVVESCLRKSEFPTQIGDDAEMFLIGLSSGYPYYLHLLGHESFNCMLRRYKRTINPFFITEKDVFDGVKNTLISSNARFEQMYSELTDKEIEHLEVMTEKEHGQIPLAFSYSEIVTKMSGVKSHTSEIADIDDVLNSLCKKQIIVKIKRKAGLMMRKQDVVYKFNEELFRIFLTWGLHNTDSISDELISGDLIDDF